MERLSIGKLAAAAGIGVETVRFYERKGLIDRPARPAGGFRVYSRETISRLAFVREAQEVGSLLFIKTTEGAAPAAKVAQVLAFTLSRAVFIGLLGALAALVGSLFLGLQKAGWLLLGALYAAIGVLYLTGRIGALMRSIGPRLGAFSSPRGSIALGAAFGLNIPACAAPLLLALLAASAAGGASGATIARGFGSLVLFGLALSLPLVAAVLFASARRALDWLAGLTRRIPIWTGVLFVVLGVWSIWFGIFVSIE